MEYAVTPGRLMQNLGEATGGGGGGGGGWGCGLGVSICVNIV